ncbi:ArsR family transcriptional regulator [Haloferax elongans ATCC BAA-1513]|uniref:ArsR family transcriptional regulator n=1 Tax=Haloferax elongans ATCC BAA-1513 TaxID=1230453 RepID=M0HRU2_HALEO|nr:metalloregulator ArsR/SmtB family transcription factor [Haloferax elongans]ELZ87305.1 ArsR family transcriptional regulator [Haloferax elongans ATCC BAA-1513]
MSESTRLRNLIEDEVGSCCDADVEARLDRLSELVTHVPSDYDADLAAMKALGNDTRYQVVRLLTAADELCVCEITPLVDVSESAVSHALSDLTDAGLVTRRKEGTWRYYQSTALAERLVSALDAERGDDE